MMRGKVMPNPQWWIFPPSSAVLQGSVSGWRGSRPRPPQDLTAAGLPFDCIWLKVSCWLALSGNGRLLDYHGQGRIIDGRPSVMMNGHESYSIVHYWILNPKEHPRIPFPGFQQRILHSSSSHPPIFFSAPRSPQADDGSGQSASFVSDRQVHCRVAAHRCLLPRPSVSLRPADVEAPSPLSATPQPY